MTTESRGGAAAPIDLILIGDAATPVSWSAGAVRTARETPEEVVRALAEILASDRAQAVLVWHSRLGAPDAAHVASILSGPGDLWHAGLRLGLAGQPPLLDFVAPTWMLQRDPRRDGEATSWRVSLECALLPTDVLRRVGLPSADFQTLSAMSLEFGHRCISAGVLARHVPTLAPERASEAAVSIPLEDQFRFIYRRYGRFWLRWAALRGAATGIAPRARVLSAARRIAGEKRAPAVAPFHDPIRTDDAPRRDSRVSVLVPTVDRYPYLRKLLEDLRQQTVPPLEILVLDQTPAARRDPALAADFSDLPLRLFQLDRAGQCSSRNLGIQEARGDTILFLDDDDEVPPTLIDRHLRSLSRFRSEVSSGVAEEDGAGPLPANFRLARASDVFPTNNSLIERGILARSGLFDLAYERGARADGDLGMRLYVSGALMVLNPEISVLHHHAPSGGLRTHRARVVTRASSRSRLRQRHLPAVTEVYLAKRYFTPAQVREALWHRALGTLRGDGSLAWRLAKFGVGLALLPDTLRKIRETTRKADALLESYPQIDQLGDAGAL